MTEHREPELATVRIPKEALEPFVAALQVGMAAMVEDSGGIEWYYPMGQWNEEHVEFALVPGKDEVMVRLSSDRRHIIVLPMSTWHDLLGQVALPD
ncbi:hypothetical protein IAG44_40305 [Streptomyces roseirectus]|uniref:Uncharacterized protein n=1 Tax=Streptomyces roseirectus TaxID=2768066 RepID=A0A7H0IQI1_9ACTN|nr:hypothetical protein [Streptomyces roseirectus]QNP75047.1 hypothetical protein IAG44_40305 [Streptomyces roseirectus]